MGKSFIKHNAKDARTLLNHSIQQMKAFQGIGDTMEDDVEMMHQVAVRIESRVG